MCLSVCFPWRLGECQFYCFKYVNIINSVLLYKKVFYKIDEFQYVRYFVQYFDSYAWSSNALCSPVAPVLIFFFVFFLIFLKELEAILVLLRCPVNVKVTTKARRIIPAAPNRQDQSTWISKTFLSFTEIKSYYF